MRILCVFDTSMRLHYVAKVGLPNEKAHSIQMFRTCEGFAANGAQVLFYAKHRELAPGHEAEPGKWPLDQATYHGVPPVYTLVNPSRHWWYFLGRESSKMRFARACLAYAAKNTSEEQVIFTRMPHMAAYAASKGYNAVLEAHNLNMLENDGWHKFREHLNGRSKSNSKFLGVVSISETLAQKLEADGAPKSKIFIAHDGIDLERFADVVSPAHARAALKAENPSIDLSPSDKVIGYCGHLYVGRGVEMLIECASRRAQWKFLIVGGLPDDISRLRALAAQKGAQNVIFTGHINNSLLANYLWACDVLTMPYEYARDNSGFMSPMKMFEYMATLRPIVAADWPQIREVLEEGKNVLLHERGNVDELERRLGDVLDDAQFSQRLAVQARHDVENYTWTARARAILNWIGGAKSS
jgi:glycosyltransferase involved in cell wall biosynthesis